MSIFANARVLRPFSGSTPTPKRPPNFTSASSRTLAKLSEFRSPIETPSGPKGMVLTIAFELDGVAFTALNGGPAHKFNEAISFVVHCETQDEDRLLLVEAHRRRQRDRMRLAPR